MKYKKIYDELIHRGNNRVLETYTEKHHIVPRCMGGSDNEDNIVALTPEEHYVAHQLLVKIYPNNHALAKAAMMMTAQRPNNKVYGWLRRRHRDAMSESQKGELNNQYGTRWIHNTKLKKSKKISKNDILPDEWCEGRIIKFDREIKKCPICNNDIYDDKNTCSIACKKIFYAHQEKLKAYELYNDFINSSCKSVTKYAESIGTSQPRLSKLWKKHVIEYNLNRKHGVSFK